MTAVRRASPAIAMIASCLGLACLASAQAQKTGSIRGTVRVAEGNEGGSLSVNVSRGETRKVVMPDTAGRFAIADVEPGEYLVSAAHRGPSGLLLTQSRRVTLGSGQELSGIDFTFAPRSEISGRVVNAKHEPLPGVTVFLVIREYTLGALRYSYASYTDTDARGAYKFGGLRDGSYLVLAQRWNLKLNINSESPADPEHRQPVLVPTFFPGTDVAEAAQPIVLRAGERRTDLDIPVIVAKPFCIEGTLETDLQPAQRLELIPAGFPVSMTGNGGLQMVSPSAALGPDRKIRLCDLPRGDYQLTVLSESSRSPREMWASTTVSLTNRDLKDVTVPVSPRLPLLVEMAWDGAPPDPPVSAKPTVGLMPFSKRFGSANPIAIPGVLRIPELPMDDYRVVVGGLPPTLYVKDMLYGGSSIYWGTYIAGGPLRLGSAPGASELRIVLGRDGGSLRVRVEEKDDKPVAMATVIVIPAATRSDAAMAAAMIYDQTSQSGDWTSPRLAPGKYLVLAATTPVDLSPESISKISRSLSRAREVELVANGSAQVTLQPMSLE